MRRLHLLALLIAAAPLVGCDEFPVGVSYEEHNGITRGKSNVDRGRPARERGNRDGGGDIWDGDWDDDVGAEGGRGGRVVVRDDDRDRPRRRDDRRDRGRDGWGNDREMPSDSDDWGRDRRRPSDEMPSRTERTGRDREMPSDREDWGRGRRMPSDEMPSDRDTFRRPLPSER